MITGASGGIGGAAARAFAAEGARLVLHAHERRERAEALAGELNAGHSPPAASVAVADLRVEADVGQLFAEAEAFLGQIDILVANAGVWPQEHVPLHRMPLARWHDTLATDLTSVFLCCREFLQHVERTRNQAPAIVLIGSTAALFGEENHADYSAAKAALTYGLTRSLKNEIVRFAERGRVNCVAPGWTATRMAAGAMAATDAVRRATATMAMRKIAQPDDVAAAIVFLASERLAGHISGAVVPVMGGMEGRLLHGSE